MTTTKAGTKYKDYSLLQLQEESKILKAQYERGLLSSGQVKMWRALSAEIYTRTQVGVDFNVDQVSIF